MLVGRKEKSWKYSSASLAMAFARRRCPIILWKMMPAHAPSVLSIRTIKLGEQQQQEQGLADDGVQKGHRVKALLLPFFLLRSSLVVTNQNF